MTAADKYAVLSDMADTLDRMLMRSHRIQGCERLADALGDALQEATDMLAAIEPLVQEEAQRERWQMEREYRRDVFGGFA